MNSPAWGGNGKWRLDEARQKVQEKAKSIFSDGKGQVSQSLDSIAQAFHRTGEQLRGQNYGSVAGYADQAAEKIEQVSYHLRDKNVDELLDEAEDLTRRQPLTMMACALITGFLLARLFKRKAA